MKQDILTIVESNYTLRTRQGVISKIAERFGVSTKTISRALHAEKSQVSHDNYVAIRSLAIREYNAVPIQTKVIKL